MYLHALLDDYAKWLEITIYVILYQDQPSKGFMSASLDIVAQAPLSAIHNQPRHSDQWSLRLTCSTGMMAIIFISASHILNELICSKINRVGWACAIVNHSCPRALYCLGLPAPTITLETPRHSVFIPSNLDIVDTAFVRPV